MDGTEDDVVWEDYVKPRESASVADDGDGDDEVDYSEENALYCKVPNPYSDAEYHQMFCSEGESDFEGF